MFRGAVALLLSAASLGAQDPALDVVLARAAGYVSSYQQQLRGLVAEETYKQNVTRMVASRPSDPRGRQSREGRELKSDLLLVKLADEDFWMQFRDVFEVDRKPVRDRDQRLAKLFIDARADAQKQAESIQQESARYVTQEIGGDYLFGLKGNQAGVLEKAERLLARQAFSP